MLKEIILGLMLLYAAGTFAQSKNENFIANQKKVDVSKINLDLSEPKQLLISDPGFTTVVDSVLLPNMPLSKKTKGSALKINKIQKLFFHAVAGGGFVTVFSMFLISFKNGVKL